MMKASLVGILWLTIQFALIPQIYAQDSPERYSVTAKALVDNMSSDEGFRGAVLVAWHEKVLLRIASGQADEAGGIRNTPNTKFEIASLTKQFTAAAILQLAERGKLSLSDSARKWMPDAPSSWSEVTIARLLNHTAGLPANMPADFPRGINVPYTPDELIQTIRNRPLLFEPGSQWRYSNSAYYVLAYIVEKASKLPFAEYLNRFIFRPLGMKDTGLVPSNTAIPGKAEGYSRKDGGGIRIHDAFDRSLELGAGGIHSTVDDLLDWNAGLTRGAILKPSSTELMFTPHPPGNYGYGWFIEQGERLRVFHEGSDPGYSAFELRYPKEDVVVIVLSNFDAAPVRKLAELLGQMVFSTN